DVRPEDAGHLHHAHRTPPRVNTPESDASVGAVPAALAATALWEQAGHSGSRFRRNSVNEVSSASNSTSRPESVSPRSSSTFRTSFAWSRPMIPGTTPSTPATEQPGASSGGGGVGYRQR